MTPRTEPAPSFNGVAASAKATCDLELGWLYRQIIIEGTVAAGNKVLTDIIDDIFLAVNGVPQRTHTCAQLAAINLLHDDRGGLANNGGSIAGGDLIGYVCLDLAETFRKNVERGIALGWNAVGIRSLQLQVKLKAVTTPTLRAWVVREPGDANRGLGPITKWKRQDLPATGTPQDFANLFDLGGKSQNFLQSIHLFPTTGTARYITQAKLKFNGNFYHDREDEVNAVLLNRAGMNPDGAAVPRYDIVLDESDSLSDPLDLSKQQTQNLNLTFNAAPSGTLTCITQETGLPELG